MSTEKQITELIHLADVLEDAAFDAARECAGRAESDRLEAAREAFIVYARKMADTNSEEFDLDQYVIGAGYAYPDGTFDFRSLKECKESGVVVPEGTRVFEILDRDALENYIAAPQPAPADHLDPKRLVCASTCMAAKFEGKPCKCYPGIVPQADQREVMQMALNLLTRREMATAWGTKESEAVQTALRQALAAPKPAI